MEIREILRLIMFQTERLSECHTMDVFAQKYIADIRELAKEALSAPPRNCDVGTATDIALKPCPFCGCADPAKVKAVTAWFGTRSHTMRGCFYRVVCGNCGCVGRTTDDDGFFYLSGDAAREAWNRRAT